jgi:NB-ARC domain
MMRRLFSCIFLTDRSNSGHLADRNRVDAVRNYAFGLSLGDAPPIHEGIFVGREAELAQMKEWLFPKPDGQNVVAVSGLGGMGKTQLCIHFAQRFGTSYSSVFWLNAKNESTLKAGFMDLGLRILDGDHSPKVAVRHDQDQMVQQIWRWLSIRENNRWLVIYDNYDDPRLPGVRSSTGYDIRRFFPQQVQGSILITTRFPRLTFAKQVRLCKLEDLHQSLLILANRSGREVEGGEGLNS